jgi:hypothetical protein
MGATACAASSTRMGERMTRRGGDGFSDGLAAKLDRERTTAAAIREREREVRRRAIPVRQRRRRRDARLTDPQIRAIYKLHRYGGLSLRHISLQLWERCGYTSWQSCYQAIRKGLYRDMRYPREPVAATKLAVTKHGLLAAENGDSKVYWHKWRRANGIGIQPRCKATTTRRNLPCQCKALMGSNFCGAHDPLRRATWASGLDGHRPRGRNAR